MMVSAEVVMRTGRRGAPNSKQRCQLKGVRQSQVLVSRTESVRVRDSQAWTWGKHSGREKHPVRRPRSRKVFKELLLQELETLE